MRFKILIFIANMLLLGESALAQAPAPPLQNSEVVDIEELYKIANPPPVAPKVPSVIQAPEISDQDKKEIQSIQNNAEVQSSKLKSVADLNKLSPFNDISIIQRKFLPKTGRYQLFLAGGLTTNSPWFLNVGAKVNFGYHFSENFGLELSGMFLSSSENQAAKEIRENNLLQPEKFILTKYNIGIDLMWSPIYGKIATLDNKIIPFDMYFLLGGGTSGTNSEEKTVPTLHVGTGQIFAISKSTAFRWDYGWYYYQATPTQAAGSTSSPSKGEYNDLIFTAGVSFFFPEANYR